MSRIEQTFVLDMEGFIGMERSHESNQQHPACQVAKSFINTGGAP